MTDTTRQRRRLEALPPDAEFALCLTHDVDRPYKGWRSLYYATRERPGYHLRTALSSRNPYWQFEAIMALEDEFDVRSAFYFLNEQHLLADRPPQEWLSPANWVQHLGRYDLSSGEISSVICDLETGGWEVGLHGSYHTPKDRKRLGEEKRALEDVLEGSIAGGRQHHLRLSRPETWHHHRAIGLEYDATLGSTTECGFHHGYHPIRPFDDEFLVFPLTIMDQALPDPGSSPEAARRTCDRLLADAARNDAVMTVLWHPRYFDEDEFPGHRGLYRWLLERAQERGAWIGSPREFCATLEDHGRSQRGADREESTASARALERGGSNETRPQARADGAGDSGPFAGFETPSRMSGRGGEP
ncbi:polysaccharide deacetylase family protein [Salinadaptatus halalkaliphilus]|uniref:polysaccharide deacetylase family protein n=1 Tax=Salinadaptatus halalkaliphilus TaxID=2419781 RepID=UPI001FEC2AB4|nr:polysaccharide deacetylase family protein [Salinadaptatus halalkaliphilus]